MEPNSCAKEDATTSKPNSDISQSATELAKVENLIDYDIDLIDAEKPIEPSSLASGRTHTDNQESSNKIEHLTIEEQNLDGQSGDKSDSIASDSTIQPEFEIAATSTENNLVKELNNLNIEKLELEQTVSKLRAKLEIQQAELDREVQKRVDLEQRFTEEAKRTTDQIEELISKSDSDDAKLAELKKKFDLYTRETSSMIENFTTNRELLASQLIELRKENDFLLAKYVSKSIDLQSADINLPQTVEELQFHCLTLNEKLILTTLAKERLEETLMQNSTSSNKSSITTTTTSLTQSTQR